jgi:outer membrane protein assembly factor BamB
MEAESKRSLALRAGTLLFPPAGLILLWWSAFRPGRKLFGTFFILLYCLPYSALVIWLLMRFTGLEVEWRGGFPPVLTYSKTVPDFGAVEKDRAQRASQPLRPISDHTNFPPPYWTSFRGPNRDGHYRETTVSTNWPAKGLAQLWHQPVGGGYASFVTANGMAFTIEQRREQEVVVAYDEPTGHELWTNGWSAYFRESMGGDGPRATPTFDNGRLYAIGAEGELRCIESSSGKTIWSKNILTDNAAPQLAYGVAHSPLIVGEKLIVQPGGPNGKSIVAYNKNTGAAIWKSLDDPAAYSSPMLVTLAGKEQLLIVTETRAAGLDVETGKLLWEHPWVVNLNNRNIAQPVILDTNRFLLSAGYNTGSEAVEITKSDSGYTAKTIWKNKFLKNKFTSSVYSDGYVYGLDEDILTCLDARTGERKWKDGRYGYGQLLLARGNLIILTGEGELALVKANPEKHEELARFQAIHGKTWNHPAISHGKLLVRNAVEMACFNLLPD